MAKPKSNTKTDKFRTESDEGLGADDKMVIIKYNRPNILTMPNSHPLKKTQFRLTPGLNAVKKSIWESSTKDHFLFEKLLKKSILDGSCAIEILSDGKFNSLAEFLDASPAEESAAYLSVTGNPMTLDKVELESKDVNVKMAAQNAKKKILEPSKESE